MEPIISKEEVDKIMNIKGEARGFAIKADGDFILQKKGEKGLKKLEDEMRRLGHPVIYKELRSTDYYPIGLKILALLVVKKIFNFTEKDFREMGEFGARLPLIIRLWMRYMGSIELIARAGPLMWKKYYTIGSLKITEYDKKKRYAIERIKDFPVHPLYCQLHKGYLAAIARLVVKSEVKVEETKCTFLGDDYHEFLMKW